MFGIEGPESVAHTLDLEAKPEAEGRITCLAPTFRSPLNRIAIAATATPALEVRVLRAVARA